MFLVELLNFLVQAQATPVSTPACDNCAASAFTAIGAAYATEGYYLQSDIIFQILNTNFGLFAPLLYILAAFGGLIGVATGAPPRTYMWFFMGPAIYSWLVDNTIPSYGVRWSIANKYQDQTQVWKLSEAGMGNINHAQYPDLQAYKDKQPNQPANVATTFLWYDELVSDTVQALTEWTGIHRQGGRGGADTNLAERSGAPAEGKHYLLSNIKWGLVENITEARLHNVDVRDAFVTFMASECGDKFGESLDQASVIAAQNTRGENLAKEMSVFTKSSTNYQLVTTKLGYEYVPTPQSLMRISSAGPAAGSGTPGTPSGAHGSFLQFLGGATGTVGGGGIPGGGFGGAASTPVFKESISCEQYLALLTQAFRWEAGHIYHQLVSNVPAGLTTEDIVYNLFYGWDIKMGRTATAAGTTLTSQEYSYFLIDLILVHLYRNEMAIAPQSVDIRYAPATKTENYVKAYTRTSGSKAKYGEIYTWALMIPHVQGVLFYLLAAGYPFACMMIVIPGMHTAVLTWAKFWLWVKLWDVGFAVVMVLERSVWAMLGNGSNSSKISDLVTEMQSWGKVYVGCPSTGTGTPATSICPVPMVVSADGVGTTFSWVNGYPSITVTSLPQLWENILKTLDRSMVLAANLDLDLSNSYYIYIMSALYFAVPAVTGQVVLGAQAGAASLATSALGQSSQEMGKAGSSGFTTELNKQVGANVGSINQEAYAKSMRKGGMAAGAIEAGNKGMEEGLNASYAGAVGQGIGNVKSQMGLNQSTQQAGQKAGFSTMALGLQKDNKGHLEWGGLGLAVAGLSALGGGDMGGAAAASSGGANNSNGGGQNSPPGQGNGSGAGGGGGGAPAQQNQKNGGVAPNASGSQSPAGQANQPQGGAAGYAAAAAGAAIAAEAKLKAAEKMPQATDGQKALRNDAIDRAKGFGKAPDKANQLAQIHGEYGLSKGYNDAAAGYSAQQSGWGVSQFAAGGASTGWGEQSKRLGAGAEFQAQTAQFNARRGISNQISGTMGAMGVDTFVLNPGNKPQDMMGMALGGQLGGRARAAANYTNPSSGGYFAQLGGNSANLNKSFGQGALNSMYNGASTPGSEMSSAVKNVGGQLQGALGSPVDSINRMGGSPMPIHVPATPNAPKM